MQRLTMKTQESISFLELTKVLNTIGDGVSIIDRGYRVLYANKGVEDVFGAGCVGRMCFETYAGRRKPCFRCLVAAGIKNPSHSKVEVEGPNGRKYFISYSRAQVKGRAIIIQTFTDITELKEREESLRTGAERMKDELISNVTHELRTPITIAKGAIELAFDEGDKEKRERLLTIGRNALLRQNNIVEDLVIAAKMEKSDYQLEKGNCNLEEIVRASVSDHQLLAKKKSLSVSLSVPKRRQAVIGDPEALKRAFTNIVGNAVKFNKNGGEVFITLKSNNANFTVSVVDTGIGIREELLERIFDRFYQVDGSIIRTYPGTGMGLNVARRIIEAHGGSIKVKSKIGKGTEFTVLLPFKQNNRR